MPKNLGPGLKELLAGAHEKYPDGLSFDSECLKDPDDNEKGEAVFKVTVAGYRGGILEKSSGHGEASPKERGAKPGTPAHDTPIRMAESRALVRALRWLTNVGETAREEMPYSDEDESNVTELPRRDADEDSRPTGKQVKFLKSLVADKMGGDWEAFAKEFGSPKELDKETIREVIDKLKEREDV